MHLMPIPDANPVLNEIMGLSPEAKTALGMAGHAMPQPPPPSAPHVMVQGSPEAKVANQQAYQKSITPPTVEPIHMPDGSIPKLGVPAMPVRGTVAGDTLERQRLLSTGPGEDQIYSKIAHSNFGQNHPLLGKILGGAAEGAAKLGDIGLSAVAPAVAINTPGTYYHHQMLLNAANNALAGSQAEEQKTAKTAETEAQAANLNLQPELKEKEAENQALRAQAYAQHISDQGQHYNQQDEARLAGEGYKRDAQGNVIPMTQQELSAKVRKDLAAVKPEQRDDRAIRILSTPEAQRTADDTAYLRGYNQWVEQTKIAPGVERAQAYAQWRPVQLVGPDGNTYYASAASAISSHAPGTSSIPFRTAAAMARYMTSGKGGATMTAYRTATDHLDLLGKAADALQNGDIPALNRIANALAQETGKPAPTNFDAVKSMLSGELANVAKVSGATDAEISQMRSQISRASSPEQVQGIIQTNQDLMDQKAQEMFEQFQAGMQGQPVATRGGINPASRTPLTTHGGGGANPEKIKKYNPATGRLE